MVWTLLVILAVVGAIGAIGAASAKQRKKRKQIFLTLWPLIDPALAEALELFDRNRFLNHRAFARWQQKHSRLRELVSLRLDDLSIHSDAIAKIKQIALLLGSTDLVTMRNGKWIDGELSAMRNWFDTVVSKPLTERQRLAVLQDEDCSLIVAGAGTGKTSTVVAKVGYLLTRGHVRPEEILVLAFAKKAQKELEQRLVARFGVRVEVRTFHSLGVSIIAETNERRPTLAKVAEDDTALERYLDSTVDALFDEPQHRALLVRFFAFHARPERSESDFHTQADYYRYLRTNRIRTLLGEGVRSYGELVIANWLFVNGIPYRYEGPFQEADTSDAKHRQYLPDFYLPDHNVYVEHFGTARDGSVAPFIDRDKYHADMAWKRALHKRHSTRLVETFYYEHREGTLLNELETRLRAHGVEPMPLSMDQLRSMLQERGEVKPVTRLLKTFLNLFKSHPSTIDQLREHAKRSVDAERSIAFLALFDVVFERYQAMLAADRAIDFHDMISLATQCVGTGRYRSPFNCVVVDEFQDISRGRAELLKALLKQADDPRLLCVGDDWQSIYRFTGSDISLMTKFADHFGFTQRTDLDKTFRFNDGVLGASSRFITANPEQLKKQITSVAQTPQPAIQVLCSSADSSVDAPLIRALTEIEQSAPDASVMLLARYHFRFDDIPSEVFERFPGLEITKRTVHQAKGLESDYVIILDVVAGRYGFPSEIMDDPVLDLLLAEEGAFPNSEERRVFYVALTRCRCRAYVLTDEANPSSFVEELSSSPYANLVAVERGDFERAHCRSCGGRLVRRTGKLGDFWSCEHFPLCRGKGSPCSGCRIGVMTIVGTEARCNRRGCTYTSNRCVRCTSGIMTPREGRLGPFWGCSNYPDCDFTRDCGDRGNRRFRR
jgi:DNA helicase-4